MVILNTNNPTNEVGAVPICEKVMFVEVVMMDSVHIFSCNEMSIECRTVEFNRGDSDGGKTKVQLSETVPENQEVHSR